MQVRRRRSAQVCKFAKLTSISKIVVFKNKGRVIKTSLELWGLYKARLYKVCNSLRCSFNSVVFLGWFHDCLRLAAYEAKHEYHDLTLDVSWRHVRSGDNSTDLASRDSGLEELPSSTLWWEGPEFLGDPGFSKDDHKVSNSFKHRDLP